MPPTSRLLQCVSMPAPIGTKGFLLIGVASLLHAKATEPPSGFTRTAYGAVAGTYGLRLEDTRHCLALCRHLPPRAGLRHD